MAKTETGVATQAAPAEKFMELAGKLNTTVQSVITNTALVGFQKAFHLAAATEQLKSLLSDEYMKPIMQLQGSRLGFKTDKDDAQGYHVLTVRDCLIEAVLMGLQPFGNQFNIIAGNCYPTKEGFGELLKKDPKIKKYSIKPELPRLNTAKDGAAIKMICKWTLHGSNEETIEEIELPIRVNAKMGTDAIIGKATRKARAWMYNTINGTEIADGDVLDTTAEVVETKVQSREEKDGKVAQSVSGLFDEKKPEESQKA